jgi:hypothetical protein
MSEFPADAKISDFHYTHQNAAYDLMIHPKLNVSNMCRLKNVIFKFKNYFYQIIAKNTV